MTCTTPARCGSSASAPSSRADGRRLLAAPMGWGSGGGGSGGGGLVAVAGGRQLNQPAQPHRTGRTCCHKVNPFPTRTDAQNRVRTMILTHIASFVRSPSPEIQALRKPAQLTLQFIGIWAAAALQGPFTALEGRRRLTPMP
jgi:hypothetical protein